MKSENINSSKIKKAKKWELLSGVKNGLEDILAESEGNPSVKR
jgi:hypothetical protein